MLPEEFDTSHNINIDTNENNNVLTAILTKINDDVIKLDVIGWDVLTFRNNRFEQELSSLELYDKIK
jgi:hypothetical protein